MGQTVPNICKGGHPLTPLCLHGGRRLNQNRTFHINTIKNQCQQSEEEWHLTPTPVWHMPYSGYISILLLRPPPLPTLTDMYPAGQRWRHRVTNCTILVNEQNTEAVLGFVFTVVSSLPSSFLSLFFFLPPASLISLWHQSDGWWESPHRASMGGHTRRKEFKGPNWTLTQTHTNRLWYPNMTVCNTNTPVDTKHTAHCVCVCVCWDLRFITAKCMHYVNDTGRTHKNKPEQKTMISLEREDHLKENWINW